MSSWTKNTTAGISLRDVFAACAAMGWACNDPEEIARQAYQLADAMLKERKRDYAETVDDYTRGWNNAAEFLIAGGHAMAGQILRCNQPDKEADDGRTE